MVLLESSDLGVLTEMPLFTLSDSFSQSHSLSDLSKKNGVILLFTCNHCPYALAIWDRFIRFYQTALQLDIGMVAINPNIHPDYPEDGVDQMRLKVDEWKIPFPYLVDEDQSDSQLYSAQCTPDLYYLNSDFKLVYHGRFDDDWQNEAAVQSFDLLSACEFYIDSKSILSPQISSMGCSIKWL